MCSDFQRISFLALYGDEDYVVNGDGAPRF
jgi:hypothetical protein